MFHSVSDKTRLFSSCPYIYFLDSRKIDTQIEKNELRYGAVPFFVQSKLKIMFSIEISPNYFYARPSPDGHREVILVWLSKEFLEARQRFLAFTFKSGSRAGSGGDVGGSGGGGDGGGGGGGGGGGNVSASNVEGSGTLTDENASTSSVSGSGASGNGLSVSQGDGDSSHYEREKNNLSK